MALAVGMLAGCAFPSAYPDLDREAGSEDAFSDDFAVKYESELDKIDPDSVRLAARDGDIDIYLMRTLAGGICLEIDGTATESGLACSDGLGSLTSGSPAGTYEVRPAPIYEEDGWRILSDNVRVKVETSESPPPAEPNTAPWESTPRPVDDSGARVGAAGEVTDGGTDAMTYVIAEGDTASDIATRFGVGIEQLIDGDGQRLGDYPALHVGDRIQFGAPLTGDDYDCFFGLAEPRGTGESCYA